VAAPIPAAIVGNEVMVDSTIDMQDRRRGDVPRHLG
jgi:hypothetical protein